MMYEPAAIRRLVDDAFDSEELSTFCFDYFPSVYDQFTVGQTKGAQVRLLLDYARRQGLLDKLLDRVREANPHKYAEHKPQLSVIQGEEAGYRRKLLLDSIPTVLHFVGREEVLTAYGEKLRRERFVIIKGMAGVGKTTLGAKLARGEAEREEQIFWFTFDPVERNTAEALFWGLAAFLESQGEPNLWRYLQGEIDTRKPLETTVKLNLLFSGLSSGDYLLCFDDFQEVRDVLDITHFFKLIQQRFAGRPQDLPARFIIMGREVPLEMEYLVSESLEGLSEEATRAFVEDQGVQLAPGLVRRLWERTGGNPKLLELGVSALAGMDGDPTAMERFVEAMAGRGDIRDYLMTEIYGALQPEEQQIVGLLSVFPAFVDREEVEDLLAAEGITGAVVRVDALVNKSIVSETEDNRIACHSLVQEYCYRILDRRVRERYHQEAADSHERAGNYLAAAHHHLQRDAQGQAVDLLTTHVRAIINAGEAGGLLEQLARFQRQELSPMQWVALCQARGDGHRMRGEYAQAVAAYEIALREATEEAARADLLYRIGLTYNLMGDYEQTMEYLGKSRSISEGLGDRTKVADAHCAIGWACYRLDRLGEAREYFAASREMGQELRDELLVAKADLGLGPIDWREGQLESALNRFSESRRIFHAAGDRVREADAVGNLGLIYLYMEDPDGALSYYRQAAEIQEEIGDVYGLSLAYNNLGDLYHRLGDPVQAVRYYEQLARLAQDTGHRRLLNTAYAGLADAHLALENVQQALDHAQDARRIAQDIGPGVELGVSCRVLGDAWLALGDPAQATTCFEQSIPLLEVASEEEELMKARRGLERARSW